MFTGTLGAALLAATLPASAQTDAAQLRQQAALGLRRAAEFFRTKVAAEGGYVWRYSADLKTREGEGKAGPTTAWVQPPGTPSVGMAYLQAHDATGDRYYLDAARDTALALVRGQLQSGGWDYRIEFGAAARKKYAYRTDGRMKGVNVTTLDDDNTQAALRFLMRVDKALGFKDAQIHEAATYALTSLLKAQYPNGAWPQRYDGFPDPKKYPIKKASYPESWSRTWPKADYRGYYTLNDNTLADTIDTLLEATRIYGDGKYRQAALKGGDFLLLAQLPEPQPAWAQQYDLAMQPAWARKFEPPAVTGGESHGAMRALLKLYRETGEKKYLEPLPRAIAYLQKSRLPDGRLARFYELKTNRPLYFTKDYKLTYDDADLPTHYGFKVGDRTAALAKEYERLRQRGPQEVQKAPARPQASAALRGQVKAILAALDGEGRWVEDGRLRYHGTDDPTRRVISSQTFARNLGVLSTYLAATRP